MILPNPTSANYTSLFTDIDRGSIKIPQFQRDFVWTVQKSAALLDSVIKGYPVGTFIFWSTKERLRSVRNLGNTELPIPDDGETVSFVLDGQQRLTSLYAAINGIIITRNSGQIDDFSKLVVNLAAEKDEQIVCANKDDLPEEAVIGVNDLLNGSVRQLFDYPEEYHDKISAYRKRIESYNFSIIQVRDVPIDVATEIFTRINVGGKPLTVFEIMVAKTFDEEKKFDLSLEFESLIKKLVPINYETISDATLLQLVSLVISKECKKQSILKLTKDRFIEEWPQSIDAFKKAIEYFRHTYRIPVSKLLPYNTLLVPFAYYFYYHPDKPSEVMRELLEDFFWRCSLGGRYSSSVESKLAQDVRKIDQILDNKRPDYDWAIDTSPEFIIDNGSFNASRSFIKAILCIYAYKEPKSFNDNSIVNISNYWLKQANSKNYHHFFPKSYLKKKGEDEELINNIVNITIVDDYLNKREIGSKAPSKYMKKFAKENANLSKSIRSHLILDIDKFGITDNDYHVFLQKRSQVISKELRKRLISRPSDELGQSIRNDDFEL